MQGGGVGTGAPWGEGGNVAGGGLSMADGQQEQQQQPLKEARDQPPLPRAVPQLPTGPFLRVLEFLPAQYRACSGRLACREAWRHLSGVHHRAAHLSQPLPPHAVPWFERYGPGALKQLSFEEVVMRPITAAAASGSEVAAVWGVVRQSLHPELLRSGHYARDLRRAGIDAALVRAGHAHLLPWLLSSGYPVDATAALEAAARHCDLPGLRAVWDLLQPQLNCHEWSQVMEQAAASCAADDVVAKMDWLMLQQQQQVHGPLEPTLGLNVAQAAVQTGDLVRLRWLLQRGCKFQVLADVYDGIRGWSALPDAMEHAGLEVVEWLVTEAGCQLSDPAAAAADEQNPWPQGVTGRTALVGAAAGSGDCGKLLWLREHGLLPPDPYLLGHAAKMAARYGCIEALRFLMPLPAAAAQGALHEAAARDQLEALRCLHRVCGVELSPGVAAAAVGSGDTGVAAWVLQQGGRGLFTGRGEGVWWAAAERESVDMVRWLVGQGFMGGASMADKVAAAVPLVAPGSWCFRAPKRQKQLDALLEAVQVVFGAKNAACSGGSSSSSSSGGAGSDGKGGGSGGVGDMCAAGASGHYRALAAKLLAAAAGHGSLPLFSYLHRQPAAAALAGPPAGARIAAKSFPTGWRGAGGVAAVARLRHAR